jgi:hypothetical protein
MRKKRNAYKFWWENKKGRGLLIKPKHIKLYIKETGCEFVECLYLVQDRDM